MASSYSADPSKLARPDRSGRLDGWKDIAAYLGRAERTVKRWERERGLPIHRVPGGAKGSVYAFGEELDRWLLRSSVSASAEEAAGADAAGEPESDEVPAKEAAPGAEQRLRPVSSWLTVAVAGSALLVVLGAAVAELSLPRKVHALFAGKAAGSTGVSADEKRLARELYLKGRYEWNQRTPESLNRALDLFTQAIVHDPGDAPSYAGLADTYNLLREYSTMPDDVAYSRAIVAARKAVELDDSLAEAHRALAFAERYGTWQFEDAEKEFRRAIQLDPNDAQVRRWYANAFAVRGRLDESLAQIDAAQELDPSSDVTLADKGLMLANAGRIPEGVQLLKEVERSAPELSSPHSYLARISLRQRDYVTYLEEATRAAETMNDPVQKDIAAAARAGYTRAGAHGLLEALYAKQKEYYLAGKFEAAYFAHTCMLLNKREEALQALETSYARHESEVIGALSDPALLALRDEPRYRALVSKIGFPMRPARTPQSDLERDDSHFAILNPLR
ncbi:tetratricopeptide repeat protein [Acidobacteria bacterium AB60]|nr:tetratricopeptide repeat protein [Acidobacteria bacterium AB60]